MNAYRFTFPENMRRIRREKGIRQSELAARLQIGRSTIACFETGDRYPTLKTFYRIAEALECEPEELVRDTKRKYHVPVANVTGCKRGLFYRNQ